MRDKLLRNLVRFIACAWFATGSHGAQAAFPNLQRTSNLDNLTFYAASSVRLPDGRQLFGGGSYGPSSDYSFTVARYNSDGTLDPSFNGTGFVQVPIWEYYEFVGVLVVQPDGRIVAGGVAADPVDRDHCYPAFCNEYPALIRLNADGTVDRSFNGTGRVVISIGEPNLGDDCCGSLTGLELQADGKIALISGRTAVARVNADGTLDRSFIGTDKVAQEVIPGSTMAIGAGFTGTWFDPQQGDQGFMLEVLPGAPMQMLATWFTFAPQGGQSWIFGLGPISGDSVTMQGIQTAGSGARFPPNFDAANIEVLPWGTLRFRFSDCNSGHVDWSSTVPGYGSGGMDLTRLTLPAGLTCSRSRAPNGGRIGA